MDIDFICQSRKRDKKIRRIMMSLQEILIIMVAIMFILSFGFIVAKS